MKHIKVFAPGTVANLGCGFDVMGLTLDGVGDVLEVGVAENAEGFEIRNRSGVELPGNVEENVITPAVRALLEAYGRPVRIEVEILEKIAPGSGIGSSAASSAAAVYGVNELLGRPFSGKQLVEFAMMGEALLGGVWKQTEEGSVSQVCEQQGRFYWVRRSGNPLNGHRRTRSIEIMQDAEGNLFLDDFRESALLLDRDEDRMQIEGYGTFKRQNG